MIVTIRGGGEELRRAGSFAFSAALHGAALAWVVIGASLIGGQPKSIYNSEIRPHESHIVWYGVRNRLPDVKPPAPRVHSPRLRAAHKSNQRIISRSRDNSRPAQMILAPAPEIRLPKPLPLPNILAVKDVMKPPAKAFVPPQPKRTTKTAPLPEAPPAPAVALLKDLPVSLPRSAPPMAFTPPEAKPTSAAALVLPAAPVIAETAPRAEAPRIVKGFTPPSRKRPTETGAEPLDAPQLSAITPAVAASSLAVVGLNPVELPKIPPPPGSHNAGFSTGPVPRKTGSDADSKDAPVTAPGLLVRSGNNDAHAALMASLAPPTSTRNLMEGLHAAHEQAQPNSPGFAGLKRSNAPDPRLEGRAVYVMGIQMPNITSESGSWLVWFAERDDQPRALRELKAPVPLRKVDPKYIAAAREERVEGAVRLFAIIRKTGAVDSVELLKSVDPRLDHSAMDALLKWQFEPAMRDGAPVDVEAVFEIPFHLKPRDAR